VSPSVLIVYNKFSTDCRPRVSCRHGTDSRTDGVHHSDKGALFTRRLRLVVRRRQQFVLAGAQVRWKYRSGKSRSNNGWENRKKKK